MTFIVACKVNYIVYLCADSAVTSNNRKIPADTTSFGELHITGRAVVEEAALKISTFCNVATAIAGDAEAAWSFLRIYKQELVSNGDAVEAFRRTALSHSPVNPHRQYTVFVAISEAQGSRLLIFNGNRKNQIDEIDNNTIACTGPMPSANRDVILGQLRELMNSDLAAGGERLTAILATLQNFGIHDYTLRHGIGGVYSGVYVDNESIHYQPRLMYAIGPENAEKSDIVMTTFFESALIVKSVLNEKFFVYSNDISIDTDELRRRVYDEKPEKLFLQAEFDYVVLLGRKGKRVVIIEMRRQSETRNCSISSTYKMSAKQKKARMRLTIDNRIIALVSGERQEPNHYYIDTSFYFIRFEEKPHE